MAADGGSRSFQDALAELAQLHERELATQREHYSHRLQDLLNEVAVLRSRLEKAASGTASEEQLAPAGRTQAAAAVQRSGGAEACSSNAVGAVKSPAPDAAPAVDHGAPSPAVSPAAPTGGPTGGTPEDPAPKGAGPTMAGPSSGASGGDGAAESPRWLWEIVGSQGFGGVLVREGQRIDSTPLAPRLATGAMVEEIELHADRLRFKRVKGAGPEAGWISTKSNGKELAVRVGRAPLAAWQPIPAAADSNSEEPLPIAIVFHQGIRGSVRDLGDYQQWPELKAIFDKASPIVGLDLMGSQDNAIGARPPMMSVIMSFAMLEKLKGERPEAVRRASGMAGSGFGQYLALYAAGVLSFEDALKLAMIRCKAFIKYAHSTGHKSMMVAGPGEEKLQSLCFMARLRAGEGSVCQISVYCNRDVFCVGGTATAVDLMAEMAKGHGFWVGLPSAVAYNTALMVPVQAEMVAALDEAVPKMRSPLKTVWGMSALGQPARPGSDPADIAADLKNELVSPFSVREMVSGMRTAGISEFHIVGPAQKQVALLNESSNPAEWETLWSEFVF